MRLNEKTNRMERRAVRFSFAIKKNALADPLTKRSVLRLRIFEAEQAVCRHVLFDRGEAADRLRKAVVRIVVVALGDLAQKHGARTRLHVEIVIEPGRHRDRFAGCETDLCACRYRIGTAVRMDKDVGEFVDRLVGERVVDPDQDIPAAAVDDVFGLEPVEMHRRVLAFLKIKKLFCVGLRI